VPSTSGATVMGARSIQRIHALPLFPDLKEMNLAHRHYGEPCAGSEQLSLSSRMHVATRSTSIPQAVDNTDWMKAAAIILVFVDHFGYFFMEKRPLVERIRDDGLRAIPTFFLPGCY